MVALARAIAGAEIRGTTLLAGIGGYAIAAMLITLGARPSTYAVMSESARDLVVLGPAFLAVGALLMTRATESGLAKELFLCGIGARSRRRATAVVAVAVSTLVWLCGSLAASVALVLWRWSREEPVALVSQSGQGVLWWAVIGLLSTALLGLVGAACGCLCRSRVAAVALVGLLAGAPPMLAVFGEFPPALWFRALCPGGALDSVFVQRDDFRGDVWLRWGVPATYLVAAAVIVGTGRRPSDPESAEQGEAPSVAPARVRRLAAVTPVALLVAAAAVLGAVAPQRIATAIPWWMQGEWVEDLARGRASEPIARAYLSAVRSGDARRERGLVVGRRNEVLDPVLRTQIRRSGHVTDVQYDYFEDARPGTVSVELGGDSDLLTLCNTRTRRGWRVVRVSTTGACE